MTKCAVGQSPAAWPSGQLALPAQSSAHYGPARVQN